MGSSQSVLVPGGGSEGYHVLKVQDNSPGQRAGLEAFFDFIVAIGGTRLDQDNDTLKELLKQNIKKPIKITVYSSKTQTVRDLMLIPNNDWGGQGLIGVSIRFCSFEGTNENVWHILEVYPNSPAEDAGLRAYTDYIIGADAIRHENDDLFTLIESHENQSLKVYVYNIDDDACREVTIKPNSQWGGEGAIGCGIGFGYLHRIPVQSMGPPKCVSQASPVSSAGASNSLSSVSSSPPTINTALISPTLPYVPPLTTLSIANNQQSVSEASDIQKGKEEESPIATTQQSVFKMYFNPDQNDNSESGGGVAPIVNIAETTSNRKISGIGEITPSSQAQCAISLAQPPSTSASVVEPINTSMIPSPANVFIPGDYVIASYDDLNRFNYANQSSSLSSGQTMSVPLINVAGTSEHYMTTPNSLSYPKSQNVASYQPVLGISAEAIHSATSIAPDPNTTSSMTYPMATMPTYPPSITPSATIQTLNNL